MSNPDVIRTVLLDVLYKDGEVSVEDGPPEDAILVPGITSNFGFHPGRLESHREEIQELIKQLPLEFIQGEGGGGGMSFLNLCQDREGNLWGQHKACEELLCLAMGLRLAGYCLPRHIWCVLPGGVPYVWFRLEVPTEEPT